MDSIPFGAYNAGCSVVIRTNEGQHFKTTCMLFRHLCLIQRLLSACTIAFILVLGLSAETLSVDWPSAAREADRLQPAPGLSVQVWAHEPQFSNGVAFTFDSQGRCYVAETHRYGRSVFDITQHGEWLLQDLSFRSPADRRDFLLETFASNPVLLTSDSEVVRRLEDPGQIGHVTESVILASGFDSVLDGTAAGILVHRDCVWFGNIPNLWKLGRELGSAQRKRIATGFGVHIGVTGHDLHGLTMGPDGKIYASFGDRGLCMTNQAGEIWNFPDTGGVVRSDLVGDHFEVFCSGLRNPQDLAFDDDGNLWTVDNDTAGSDPCRVLLLRPGADYGWRCSYQHQLGFGPWVQEELWKGGKEGIPPLSGTVSQGPSGLAWYPGTGFGPKLQGCFLHCDFPQGITSFSLQAEGAGFRVGKNEHFLWNCWATDVEFGPDGAAYVLDWVNGWQMPNKGRIYRITSPQFIDLPETHEVFNLLRTDLTLAPEGQLGELMNHVDRRIRLAAQFEWARRGSTSIPWLLANLKQSRNRLGQLHTLWALGQLVNTERDKNAGPTDLSAVLDLLDDSDSEVAGQALLLAVGFRRDGVVPLVRRILRHSTPRIRLHAAEAVARALEFVGGERPKALEKDVVSALLKELLESEPIDPWIEQGIVRALALEGEAIPDWIDSPLKDLRRVGLLAARKRAMEGFQRGQPLPVAEESARAILQLLNDSEPELLEEAVRAIHDVPLTVAFPAMASLITRIDLPAGALSRVIDANFRLGASQHAQAIASFALRRDVPDAARGRAILALGEWGHPSPIDAVNGLWHPLVPGTAPAIDSAQPEKFRAPQSSLSGTRFVPARFIPPPIDLGRTAPLVEGKAVKRNELDPRRAFLRIAGEILNSAEPDRNGIVVGGETAPEAVQLAVVTAAVQLRTREASHPLADHFRRANTPLSVRAAIVGALVQLHASEATDIVREALKSPDSHLKTATVEWLDKMEGDDAVELFGEIIQAALSSQPGALPPAQAALAGLGRLNLKAAQARLEDYIQLELQQHWPNELLLDLREAVRLQTSESLRSKADGWLLRPDEKADRKLWAPWLQGGDSARGSRIFRENQAVQCLRCHRIGSEGGTVGPALDGIGKRAGREELLESIIAPNARLARGFESVVVRLHSGETVTGVIRNETDQVLDIESPDEDGKPHIQPIPKATISGRDRAPSAMPEGLAAALTPLDLRDLVEFLSSL